MTDKKLKDDLRFAANKLRVDSDLKSNDYTPPVPGIISLKFYENTASSKGD